MTSGKTGTARHGTMSAVNRHWKLGEDLCVPCKVHSQDWARARGLRIKSGFRLSMADALAELGLPRDRIPAGVS